jgi:hypothetical protein
MTRPAMTHARGEGGRGRSSVTQRMTQLAAALALLGALSTVVAACGRYGPPEPYPPGVEAPDDDEERR